MMRRNLKRTGLIAAMVIMISGFCGCNANSELPECFDEETVETEVKRSIEYFNERDYQSVIDMGEGIMDQMITAEAFAEQADPYLDKCGEFEEIEKLVLMGSTDKKTGAKFGGAVVVAAYEDGKIRFTIGFDEDMKLVQFLIQ